MSWIQENKFAAGLAGVTVVLGGAILYFGSSQGSAYEEKLGQYEEIKSQHTSLSKSKPYPDSPNLNARKQGMEKYEQAIEEVRTSLAAYSPGKLENMTPEQFSDSRVAMEKSVRSSFESAKTALPEDSNFGFERYAKGQAKGTATGELNYQLQATRWLLTELAKTKPEKLINIERSELAVETGKAATPAPPKKGKKGKKSKAPMAAEKPYKLMPMELTFTARESAVRDFLKAMVNSDKYFYSIRAIRVRNEKQIAPTVKDADFPDNGGGAAPAAGEADPFGGVVLPDDGDAGEGGGEDDGQNPPAPAPIAEPSNDRILKQVLGKEKLDVHIVFDIVLIKPNQLKKPAAEAKKPAAPAK